MGKEIFTKVSSALTDIGTTLLLMYKGKQYLNFEEDYDEFVKILCSNIYEYQQCFI